MPPALTLYLLGPFHAELDGAALTAFESAKARALLAYLALDTDFPAQRETLADIFWPKLAPKAQRHNLSQALLSLRKTLRDTHETPRFVADRHTIKFQHADVWIDLMTFEALLATCRTHQHARPDQCVSCAARRADAVALYRDDFLAGLNPDASAVFDDWVMLRRERAHRQTIEALHWLGAYHEGRGEMALAEGYARRQVKMEPWREEAHRQLMRILAHGGQRSAALAQYGICRQVLAEELGVDPAPDTTELYEHIRAANERRAYRLPEPATPFVGRREAVATLSGLLADPELRLVTIIGPGGIGKTRLALQAAKTSEARFLDGTCFVPLAGLSDASQLFAAIVSALELTPGLDEAARRLASFVRERELLLVLDNMEHLQGADAVVRRLLEWGPKVHLLVTSRTPLNVSFETRYRLEGMAVPEREEQVEVSLTFESLQFFDEAARRIQPGFRLAEAAQEVIRICQMLHGTPLALEIAATWLQLADPAEVAAEIGRSLNFLVARDADLPARHRSLQAVFAHSWDLLNAEERQGLARVSVFRGSFTRESARVVAGVTRFTLVSLLDRSLLRRTSSGRFAIHQLIREFAAERVEEQDEAGINNAHAEFYLALLKGQEAMLQGPEAARALLIVRAELDNIRQGWRQAVRTGRLEPLAAGAPALAAYCHLAGLVSEGAALLAAAINAVRIATQTEDNLLLLGPLLVRQAGFVIKLGMYDQAEDVAAEALSLVERTGSPEEAAVARIVLGRIAEFKGDYELAHIRHQAALDAFRASGSPPGTSEALNGLGNVHWRRAEFQEALPYFAEALALDRATGNQVGAAQNLGNMGIIYKEIGQFDEALSCLRRAMTIVESLGHEEGIARNANNIGLVYWQTGRRHEALSYYQRAAALAEKLGIKRGIAITLTNVGVINRELGRYETALDYYRQASAVAREIGFMPSLAMSLGNIANIYRDMGRFEEAMPFYDEAIGIDEDLGNKEGVARHLGEIGRLEALSGKSPKAIVTLARAIKMMRELDTRYYLAMLLPLQAELLLARGDLSAAERLNQEGAALAEALGRHEGQVRAAVVKARLAAIRGEKETGVSSLRLALAAEEEIEHRAPLAFALWELTEEEGIRLKALEAYGTLAERTPNATYHQRVNQLQSVVDDS